MTSATCRDVRSDPRSRRPRRGSSSCARRAACRITPRPGRRRCVVSQIPSDVNFMANGRELDKDEIRRLRREHVEGAKRARDAGFDLLTLYCGLGTFPIFFLYPFYNRRTDEYGGSFENRIRFTREVLEEMRADDRRLRDRLPVRDRHARGAIRVRRPRRPSRRRRGPLHRAARPAGRLLGPQHRHAQLGRGRRFIALLRDQPRGAVHAHRQDGRRASRASTSGGSPTPT